MGSGTGTVPGQAPPAGSPAGGATPLLEIVSLSKTFPGQVALQGASLTVMPGQIHALVGQNGSGKSTLIKLLAGYHRADDGADVRFLGERVALDDMDRSRLHVMHQDLGLVLSLTATENLALGVGFQTGRWGRIHWRQQRTRAAALLARFGVDVDPSRPVGELAASERAILSLVRAMQDWDGAGGVLILDEPTASLPRPEVDRLFSAMRRIASQGAGIIFVSHRLDEVFEIADFVTVLRNGRTVAHEPIGDLTQDRLIEHIVGRPLEELYAPPPVSRKEVVLRLDRLWGSVLEDVSLDVHAGEIVGVAGLLGSGRDELPALVFGAARRAAGTVLLDGRKVPGDPRAAVAQGLAFVPADRKTQGSIQVQTVAANITLPRLRPLYRNGWLTARSEKQVAQGWIGRLDIRPADPDAPLSSLSGGNQQKAVLARWLRTAPRAMVLDEPTQGVDVGSKATIYQLLAAAASEGTAVLVCSSDAEELTHICDRVVVLRHGRLAAELSGAQLTANSIVEQSLR